MTGGCKLIGTDVTRRAKWVEESGVGETSSNLTDVDGICEGPDSETTKVACCEAKTLTTVLGGVGKVVDPFLVTVVGVDVASVVLTPYHGSAITCEAK